MADKKIDYALPAGAVLHSPKREYNIEAVLGAGGFGVTYVVRGKIENVSCRFAIKEHFMRGRCRREPDQSVTCPPELEKEVSASRRDFVAEASRLNKEYISHPSLVGINEVFEANGTAYFVMEHITGPNLFRYVTGEHPGGISEKEALDILAPVLDATDLLHSNRITHLDIKPDNILLSTHADGSRRPVLIDFGLSKHYDSEGRPTTQVNLMGCSEGYSPIEQYAGINTFSPTADIYSLAATLLFMLTGHQPPKASEMSMTVVRDSLTGRCSERTIAALSFALALGKDNRTQSVAQFAEDLGIENPNRENIELEERIKAPKEPMTEVQAPQKPVVATPAPQIPTPVADDSDSKEEGAVPVNGEETPAHVSQGFPPVQDSGKMPFGRPAAVRPLPPPLPSAPPMANISSPHDLPGKDYGRSGERSHYDPNDYSRNNRGRDEYSIHSSGRRSTPPPLPPKVEPLAAPGVPELPSAPGFAPRPSGNYPEPPLPQEIQPAAEYSNPSKPAKQEMTPIEQVRPLPPPIPGEYKTSQPNPSAPRHNDSGPLQMPEEVVPLKAPAVGRPNFDSPSDAALFSKIRPVEPLKPPKPGE